VAKNQLASIAPALFTSADAEGVYAPEVNFSSKLLKA